MLPPMVMLLLPKLLTPRILSHILVAALRASKSGECWKNFQLILNAIRVQPFFHTRFFKKDNCIEQCPELFILNEKVKFMP